MVLPLVAHIVEIKDYLQCIVLDFFDNSVFWQIFVMFQELLRRNILIFFPKPNSSFWSWLGCVNKNHVQTKVIFNWSTK